MTKYFSLEWKYSTTGANAFSTIKTKPGHELILDLEDKTEMLLNSNCKK